MPSSNPDLIGPVMQLVIELKPKSVLDLGVGFGKYGFLCREYLETYANGVFKREDWKARIDGVEVFTQYLAAHQLAVYNALFPLDLDGPGTRAWIERTQYDLYLAADVLEHLYYWKELLTWIPRTGAIIAVSPNGASPQGPVFDNPHETHVQTFSADDLMPYFDSVTLVNNKLLCFRAAQEN